jgi:hypothetical protein
LYTAGLFFSFSSRSPLWGATCGVYEAVEEEEEEEEEVFLEVEGLEEEDEAVVVVDEVVGVDEVVVVVAVESLLVFDGASLEMDFVSISRFLPFLSNEMILAM